MSFQFYEFFAGAGLARLGLEPAWKCVWANDIDPRKGAVYAENFPPASDLDLRDVADVDPARMPSGAYLAWASFPCQDLSLAGWRRGMSAERSGTFWAFWRIMRDRFDAGDRPPIIVVENVAGLLYGQNFVGLAEALAALGMQFGPLLLDASLFLPQSRPRVFIVAVDRRVNSEPFIEHLPSSRPWFPPAVAAAHASLPRSLSDLWRWWRLPIPPAMSRQVEDLIEDSPTGVEWNSAAETKRLLSLMTPVNRDKIRAAGSGGRRRVGFLYKRTRGGEQKAEVRFDGVAGCLRTPGGGSSRQTVVVVEGKKVSSRLLSPREAARLMGVDDGYKLPARYNDAYFAMGDGVVVPVVSWLSRHLLLPLAEACSKAGVETRGHSDTLRPRHLASRRRSVEGIAARWEAGRR